VRGIKIKARADRIDQLPDGTLAIVDYKTGAPPSGTRVENGVALQLGLIGLIAAEGGVTGVSGLPHRFEYWSLSRRRDGSGFGWSDEPILAGRKKTGVVRAEFLDITRQYLHDALDRWILGSEPFTARLNPNLAGYSDYDQLMRLDEWVGRGVAP
jgi:ATP-dependent helicase/nuclease subunit B